MTENQRNYLADLAGQKGIRLSNTDNWSVAKASEEIERLKTMPDVVFDDINEDQIKKIDSLTVSAITELNKWGFVRGRV